MTVEEILKLSANPLWYGEQDENGVDLSLIRENLRLTPEERLLRGDRGRYSALELLRYGEEHRRRQSEQRAAQKRDAANCNVNGSA